MKAKQRIEGQRDRWLRIEERKREDKDRKELMKMIKEKEEHYTEMEKEKEADETLRRVMELLAKERENVDIHSEDRKAL